MDLRCPTCGHYKDTPNHEFTCGAKKYTTVQARFKIRRSWIYNAWIVVEEFPAYLIATHHVGTWKSCVDYLKGSGW